MEYEQIEKEEGEYSQSSSLNVDDNDLPVFELKSRPNLENRMKRLLDFLEVIKKSKKLGMEGSELRNHKFLSGISYMKER